MRTMLAAVAALVTTLVLGACGSTDEAFAELEPRALPDNVDSLARADGWEVTDDGVRAQAGDTFELVVPSEEVPAGTDDQTEIVYHLDRVEADGTIVETVDIVAVTVTAQDTPRETVTLPDDTDAHYKLYAEVTRPDGSFTAYHDWLYVP